MFYQRHFDNPAVHGSGARQVTPYPHPHGATPPRPYTRGLAVRAFLNIKEIAMNRSGYSDDCGEDDPLVLGRWRGADSTRVQFPHALM